MTRTATLAICGCLLATSGCATMLRSSKVPVQFTSDPPGAVMALTGQWSGNASESSTIARSCTTPCTIILPRSNTPVRYRVTLPDRPDFADEITPYRHVRGVWIVPIAFDLLLGLPFMIDVHSNTMWTWPQSVAVTLPDDGQGPGHAVVER